MKTLKAAVLMAFVLCAGWSAVYGGTAGESASTIPAVPQEQFDAYIEVFGSLSANPGVTPEEMDLLLKKNGLTAEEYEKIDRQVQADPELQEKVKARLESRKSGPKETEKPSNVRTKLKEPSPEIPAN